MYMYEVLYEIYDLTQFSLRLSYHLVHGMDGVYFMSSYSRFCFPHVASGFSYYRKVKSAVKAELLIFS